MQAVFEIAEVGEQTRVAVGHVVAVQIVDNRQVRSIGNPQVTAVPGQALDAVEARGENVTRVKKSRPCRCR